MLSIAHLHEASRDDTGLKRLAVSPEGAKGNWDTESDENRPLLHISRR
jgi:hypothetical protein